LPLGERTAPTGRPLAHPTRRYGLAIVVGDQCSWAHQFPGAGDGLGLYLAEMRPTFDNVGA